MNSYEVMNLFADQLRRNVSDGSKFRTKVVVTPSSVSEAGVVIKVSLLKTARNGQAVAGMPLARAAFPLAAARGTMTLRFRVSVCGRAESMTGLEQALEAIERLDGYLSQQGLRLEQVAEGYNGMTAVRPVPNTRITQSVSQEDSFVPSPDSTAVQDVQDDRTVTITVPYDGADKNQDKEAEDGRDDV